MLSLPLPPALNGILATPVVRNFTEWATRPPFGPLNALHKAHLHGREWNNWSAVVYGIGTLPLLLQGFLITQPGTRAKRAALGVLGLAMYVSVWLEYRFNDPAYNMANASLSLYSFFVIARYLEWSCLKGPLVDPRLLKAPKPLSRKVRFLSALDMTINFRNIGIGSVGFDYSLGPRNEKLTNYHYVHTRWAPLSRPASIARHAYAALWRYAALDVFVAFVRALGPDTLCRPGGRPGAINAFVNQWEGPQKVLAFVFANCAMSTMTAFALGAGHHAIASLATLTFWEHSSWDFPLFDSPLLATSINELWGRRWQQVIRHYMAVQSMLVMAILPPFLRGRATYMILVFHFSGLLHIIGHLGMEPVPDPVGIYLFFVVSGVGCIIERAYRSITGRRVGGFLGWVWATSFLVVSGKLVSDAWFDAGFPVLFTRAPRLGLGDAIVAAVGLTPQYD